MQPHTNSSWPSRGDFVVCGREGGISGDPVTTNAAGVSSIDRLGCCVATRSRRITAKIAGTATTKRPDAGKSKYFLRTYKNVS